MNQRGDLPQMDDILRFFKKKTYLHSLTIKSDEHMNC